MRKYERLGFARAPELDFKPAANLTVKGYRLDLAAKIESSTSKELLHRPHDLFLAVDKAIMRGTPQ
jgi:hypothetical protein